VVDSEEGGEKLVKRRGVEDGIEGVWMGMIGILKVKDVSSEEIS